MHDRPNFIMRYIPTFLIILGLLVCMGSFLSVIFFHFKNGDGASQQIATAVSFSTFGAITAGIGRIARIASKEEMVQ